MGRPDALSFFPANGSTFGILTTGDVNLADDANTAEDTGVALGGLAVRGDTDRDVTILKLDLNVPAGANCLILDFAFYSDEFAEFVGSQYNDAFIAEVDNSTWTTTGSTISAPNNFAFDSTGDVVSINSTGATSMNTGNAAGTTYDGATVRLQAASPIGDRRTQPVPVDLRPGRPVLRLGSVRRQHPVGHGRERPDRLHAGRRSRTDTDTDSHPDA